MQFSKIVMPECATFASDLWWSSCCCCCLVVVVVGDDLVDSDDKDVTCVEFDDDNKAKGYYDIFVEGKYDSEKKSFRG